MGCNCETYNLIFDNSGSGVCIRYHKPYRIAWEDRKSYPRGGEIVFPYLDVHCMMDDGDVSVFAVPRVKATMQLGSESFVIKADNKGSLSQQLAAMKEECMVILKDFITKTNAPNDVPYELLEEESSEDDKTPDIPSKKIKKK